MPRMPPARKFRAPTTAERPFSLPLTERQIQRAVFEHIRKRGIHGLIAFHPKNGGVHQETEAQRRANWLDGVETGASDVMALYRGKFYALELKKIGEKPTKDQERFLQRVWDQGGIAGWAAGLDDALAWLESRGLLIGEAV